MVGFIVVVAWEVTGFTSVLRRLVFGGAQLATKPSLREKRLGFSAHLIVRVRDVTSIRRKYVFDAAAPDGARVAFYQSASDRFVLRVTDVRGESYTLAAPIGQNGIPFGEFFYLRAEIGIGSTTTDLCLGVNGADVQNRVLSFPLDLGSRNWNGMVIGADISRQNHGGFDLGEFIVYSTTLNTQEADGMTAYLLEKWVTPSAAAGSDPPATANQVRAEDATKTA